MFCGAGGTSSGLLEACEKMGIRLNLIAINHWPIAIDTHKANHDYAQHYCDQIDNVNPRKLVPSGRLHVLVASPECTHHSNARGGRPMSEQSRASAWHVLRWAEALYIENILVENVREFRSWGPLGANGRPILRLKGELYIQFLNSLRALGYRVEDRVLNAADYGDPTTRERLFIIARRGPRRIIWPARTHAPAKAVSKQDSIFDDSIKPWRTAREVIDWSIPGHSIFERKRPLAPKTLARIAAGLRKFGGANAEPFLIILRRHADAIGLDVPLPTITAKGNHIGLVQPFLIGQQSGAEPRNINEPVPTIATKGAVALVEPFVMHLNRERDPSRSVSEPMQTVTAQSADFGLVEPFVLNIDHQGGNGDQVRSIDEPLNTVTTKARACLIEPFIVPQFSEREGQVPRCHSVNDPLPAVTGHGAGALIEPFLIDVNHGNGGDKHADNRRAQSLDEPLGTFTTKRAKALIDPFLVKYNRTGSAHSLDDPLDTISTRDRFGLVETETGTVRIDIRFRMLEPHELAAAQGFKNYKFKGKKTEIVKQIGNAVPHGLATALSMELIS